MEPVLERARPDVVLVHGDTTTSTSAALAAFYRQIPVGHVEAGLRTSDRWLPYPEEMNRRLTGTIAAYHFTDAARARAPAARKRRCRRHRRHRQHGHRRVYGDRGPQRSFGAAALGRTRAGAADRPRHRASSRESRVHAPDGRGDARDRADAAAPATLLAGSSVAARRSDRTRRPRWRTWRGARRADRLRADGLRGAGGDFRADRLGRASRGGALSGQAGAR